MTLSYDDLARSRDPRDYEPTAAELEAAEDWLECSVRRCYDCAEFLCTACRTHLCQKHHIVCEQCFQPLCSGCSVPVEGETYQMCKACTAKVAERDKRETEAA